MTETQRVAIVTGAAGGIGRAMVHGLLAAGIRVAGVDRDRAPLEALAASAREQGKTADLLTMQTDLRGRGDHQSHPRPVWTHRHPRQQRRHRPRRNPAGQLAAPAQILGITPDQWRRFVAVHTTAPLTLANAVVPEMMRQGWGRIVNVTTSLGTMINPGFPTYGPSKAALRR